MSERSDADLADDGADLNARQREGALRDELGSRHLAYRRQLEQHLEVVQAQLIALAASGHVHESLPVHDPLPTSYRRCKEARALYDAARDALLHHRARH